MYKKLRRVDILSFVNIMSKYIIYTCPRCSYTSNKRSNILNHFKSKKMCPNIGMVELTEEVKDAASKKKTFRSIPAKSNISTATQKNDTIANKTNQIESLMSRISQLETRLSNKVETNPNPNPNPIGVKSGRSKAMKKNTHDAYDRSTLKFCQGEYIYIIKTREHLRCGDLIIKIGRTKNIVTRMRAYPKGSLLILNQSVTDSKELRRQS